LAEGVRDITYGPGADPGIDVVIEACANWLLLAQACSASGDGGVASHYSLKDGWATSYPETTGYIIPTLLRLAKSKGRPDLLSASLRMLEWLESIQREDGSFQGGNIDSEPKVPVVFNTGQILFGLVAGVSEWGEPHIGAAKSTADWLVSVQDGDGAWRKHRSPFTTPGPKTYETHVAWGLLEADRAMPGRGYGAAALKQIQWAISRQTPNGWFEDCGLGENEAPITHTIGYALRGVIEGWRFSGDAELLAAARRCADQIAHRVDDDGWLSGKFDREWKPLAKWVCVTGSAQLAHCFLLLHAATAFAPYLEVARRLNCFVRSTIHVSGGPNVLGAVKGSFPINGGYGPNRFLNWAAKFTIDSNLEELGVRERDHAMVTSQDASPHADRAEFTVA
jgi:hypothetical protein